MLLNSEWVQCGNINLRQKCFVEIWSGWNRILTLTKWMLMYPVLDEICGIFWLRDIQIEYRNSAIFWSHFFSFYKFGLVVFNVILRISERCNSQMGRVPVKPFLVHFYIFFSPWKMRNYLLHDVYIHFRFLFWQLKYLLNVNYIYFNALLYNTKAK